MTATVTLKASGQTIEAVGAWVICPPPDFAPSISHVITLYDTLLQVAVDKLGLKLPAKPSFTRDIYPLLRRAIDMKWVSKMVADAHAHVTLEPVIPPPGDPAMRKAIFNRLRNPNTPGVTVSEGKDMPMVHSDYYPAKSNEPLTRTQYRTMRKWRDGNFINDWSGPPKQDKVIRPAGLDRAALEACVGGAFSPASKRVGSCATNYASSSHSGSIPQNSSQATSPSRWRFPGRRTSTIARKTASWPGGLRSGGRCLPRSRRRASLMGPRLGQHARRHGREVAPPGLCGQERLEVSGDGAELN